METVNFEQLVSTNDGKYVVITDFGVIISKQGKYCFDDIEEAIEVKNNHIDLADDIDVMLIQNGLDEYGVIQTELIKCA